MLCICSFNEPITTSLQHCHTVLFGGNAHIRILNPSYLCMMTLLSRPASSKDSVSEPKGFGGNAVMRVPVDDPGWLMAMNLRVACVRH